MRNRTLKNTFSIKAFILSLLGLLFSILLSSPLYLLTKLEVRKNFLTDRVTSYCYEVPGPIKAKL